ncbi:hypothetical protein HanRHA438_Chr07g0293001 [Helianthus annuus]|nr:hypothetical protein HanRHA438_Chr07g0293001 [Helianthus annuus]
MIILPLHHIFMIMIQWWRMVITLMDGIGTRILIMSQGRMDDVSVAVVIILLMMRMCARCIWKIQSIGIKKKMDAYISKPYQGYRQYHPEEYSKPEGVYAYQTEEEKKLAMLEASLSKLEQYLLAPNPSDEDRISCLVSKCQKLKKKIEIEERLSPLPDDIRDYSHMEEEVVEDNTTPMNPLSDEESLVGQMVCEDEEAEQSDEMNVCTEPLPISIIQINKCGEEGSRKKMRRVKQQDIRVHIGKWISETRMCFLNMPIILTNLWSWHVNFRAFVGNVLGKCALRPP